MLPNKGSVAQKFWIDTLFLTSKTKSLLLIFRSTMENLKQSVFKCLVINLVLAGFLDFYRLKILNTRVVSLEKRPFLI